MAGNKQGSKPLVIVESPAKARTIAKILGGDFVIEASVGHIRDLPANAAEVPAAFKKEKWARLGIDIDDDFRPLYVVPKDKRETIRRLKQLAKSADVLYLATDEDREGEAISWHLVQELKPKGEVQRLVFHEITEEAIRHALEHPRPINQDLVEAQETRRLVDRLYGYSVSPVLWKKIRPRLSAGRVQSVAVRMVVDRERERIRFVAAEYWDIAGEFLAGEQRFGATLTALAGRRIAVGKDFDADTGRLKKAGADAPLHLTEQDVRALTARLEGRDARVADLEQKPFTERPSPPFTTSTLQQEAGRKLGFTAKRAMRAAQRLYENGYITYMRTDSTTLSQEAITAARTLIEKAYGAVNLPPKPRVYQTKVKNAQEAHEAIRPAGSAFVDPKALGRDMGGDERRIYELIWKRTVACQMKDATGKRTTLGLAIDDARFQTSGKTIEFPGFRLAYVERGDENGNGNGNGGKGDESLLPNVAVGDVVATERLVADGHTTKPPARLTEASLIKEMEARGIGRPSTYASIIDTILNREFVFKKGNALAPTFTAFAVVNLLEQHLEHLVDYAFTARMEDDLDEISNGRKGRLSYLRGFYIGNGQPGLRETLDAVDERIDPREVCTLDGFGLGDADSGAPIEVRVGRYGPFVTDGESSATIPDGIAPDELDRDTVVDLLRKAAEGPKALGTDPGTGLKVYVKVGRFGPYFQRGDAEELGDEKPKMASLLAGMEPETVTLDQALQVLALPREVGVAKQPGDDGEELPILAHNGRYGPYLKWGTDTRSIPAGEDLLTIGLPRALELFAQPKQRGRSAGAQPKVIKELGEHPESKVAVRVLEGRYGAYVSDGTVNATIPKDEDAGGIGLARAVELLEARAARGGKKKTAKKKAAKKKAKKKTPQSAAAEAKPAKKKTAKKKAKGKSRAGGDKR